MKTILVLSDQHVGHKFGLCPNPVNKVQEKLLDWYVRSVTAISADVVVNNGDLIDGNGEKSGGVELITTDRNEQISMAQQCLEFALKPKSKLYIISGTGYHVGKKENWEQVLAARLGAEFGTVLDLDVEGKVFNFRHKLGSSSVPYGRLTALAKEQVWNALTSIHRKNKRADVIVRSHVHYWKVVCDSFGISMSTPCLQVESRFGLSECQGNTDIGFVVFYVDKGKITWEIHEWKPSFPVGRLQAKA